MTPERFARGLTCDDDVSVTGNTKSARLVYMFVRKSCTMSMMTSGRRAQSAGPQPVMLFW